MRPIVDVAAELDLSPTDLHPWGPDVAKVDPAIAFREDPARARLVLVSAMSPTPAGEGKTTCSIGLTQGARLNGVRAACALREPSLGPVFGAKGGGTGGGRSTLEPSERINLHFTGDLHAITAANNLLAALADNAVYFDDPPRLDARQLTIRRVMDINDRFLRDVVSGLGGRSMGVPRETAFDITAASEVMAVLCLSRDYADLKARLGRMLVGFGRDGRAVRASDLKAEGAMAALLRDAMAPNLVQTVEGAPAVVHGGPFGNIAHGCNSIVATRFLLRRADLVFTEAGFGFDLGAEKFLDIKCRTAGIWPHAVVLVATVRALKYHGGVPVAGLAVPDREAIGRGLENLRRHIESARHFGFDPVVMLNVRADDSADELQYVRDALREDGVDAFAADIFGQGGGPAREIAAHVHARAAAAPVTPSPRHAYELSDPPIEKVKKVARAVYGAADVEFSPTARKQIEQAVALGMGEVPVCIAKTHLSLSDDARRIGRPRDFVMTVREVRMSAGAGFLVALTGEITTMPGLPKQPHSANIDLRPDGQILGVK